MAWENDRRSHGMCLTFKLGCKVFQTPQISVIEHEKVTHCGHVFHDELSVTLRVDFRCIETKWSVIRCIECWLPITLSKWWRTVFRCIECWLPISNQCPVCKQSTECTKLYLDLDDAFVEWESKVDQMERTLSDYKKLAAAQSKSIAEKSCKLWESELEIKAMKESVASIVMEKQIKKLNIEIAVNQQHPMCLYPVFKCTCNRQNMTAMDPVKVDKM